MRARRADARESGVGSTNDAGEPGAPAIVALEDIGDAGKPGRRQHHARAPDLARKTDAAEHSAATARATEPRDSHAATARAAGIRTGHGDGYRSARHLRYRSGQAGFQTLRGWAAATDRVFPPGPEHSGL